VAEDRSPVGRLFGALVPRAVDAVDPDALIGRVDIEGLIERVDVDGLIKRVDLDELLARIDIDDLLDRIDIAKLLERIDVDALVGRIDVDALVARIDLDQLMGSVDVRALVARAGIDEIVAEATTGVAQRTLDLARRQLVGIDLILLRVVDRALRRPRPVLPPGELSASGRPAGPVSRVIGFLLDSALVSVLFALTVFLGRSLFALFVGHQVAVTRSGGRIWGAAFLAWWFIYLWAGLEIAGRSPGKALVGLRIQAIDGTPLGPWKAALRTLLLPVSLILGLGYIPAIVRRDRRAFHDLVAGSQEIVDWGERQAVLPSALERWVEQSRGGAAPPVAAPPAPAASGVPAAPTAPSAPAAPVA